MSQMQKRCLLASAGLHGLLLLALMLGSYLFVATTPPASADALEIVPSRLVDEVLQAGLPQPSAPQPQQARKEEPRPTPPEPVKPPEPKKEEPVKPPEPKKTEPPKPKPPEPKKTEIPKPPEKKPRNILEELQPLTKDTVANRQAAQEKKPQTQEAAKAVQESMQRLQGSFSPSTKISYSGPRGSGAANYAAFVRKVYDDAWQDAPADASDEAEVIVEVKIAADGMVANARILRRSGNAALDKSVERVLRMVKFVAKFPEGSTDKFRSYEISFNLKSRRLTG